MNKKKSILAAAMAVGLVAGACVVAYNPNCPDQSGVTCPDKSSHTSYCTSTDTKQLNNDVGKSSGFFTTNSSGSCRYTCVYTNAGVGINCGNMTNSWSGTKPNGVTCPDSSGNYY